MECDICCRKHTSDLNFFCVGCARSSIYFTRLEIAKVLIAKEQLALKVEAVVSTNAESTRKSDPSPAWQIETAKAHIGDAEDRTQETLDHVRKLREELEQARKDISARKAHLANRKVDLETINARLSAQRSQREIKLSDTTKRGNLSFAALDDRSIETRAFLCREAAVLLGLKQRKKRKGDSIFDQYYLAGLPIIDLKACYSTFSHLSIIFSRYIAYKRSIRYQMYRARCGTCRDRTPPDPSCLLSISPSTERDYTSRARCTSYDHLEGRRLLFGSQVNKLQHESHEASD
jgi:hypothetical protein